MFGNLGIQNSSGGGIVLDSDMFVLDSLGSPCTAVPQAVFGQGNTITACGFFPYYLVLDNAPLIAEYDVSYSTATQVSNTTFQNMTDGVTQFRLSRTSGGAGFGSISFADTVTGMFFHVTDTDGGSDFTVSFDCAYPADRTGRVQQDNTASVNWSCI